MQNRRSRSFQEELLIYMTKFCNMGSLVKLEAKMHTKSFVSSQLIEEEVVTKQNNHKKTTELQKIRGPL